MTTDRQNYSPEWAGQVAANLEMVRQKPPLIYAITNFVTMNDVANSLLALGASPVMAQAPQEVEDIVKASQAILVNLGTLTSERLALIQYTVTMAEKYGKTIVFDPVGAGGTGFRTTSAKEILEGKAVRLLRSNLGEAAALAGIVNTAETRGVDSVSVHKEDNKSDNPAGQVALSLARQYPDLTVAITGSRDWVANKGRLVGVDNGVALLRQVSGAGCMLGGISAAFASLVDPLEAAVSALTVFGIAAELAAQQAAGPGSLRLYLMDALYNLTPDHILESARILEVKVEQAYG
ncbi:MAG: Hydroxyethylthiazole kinase [Chloroflexi bacterium]|nr:Hydroxyethylthiazole kinase [Chloroflexota bacterium]